MDTACFDILSPKPPPSRSLPRRESHGVAGRVWGQRGPVEAGRRQTVRGVTVQKVGEAVAGEKRVARNGVDHTVAGGHGGAQGVARNAGLELTKTLFR